MGEIKMAVEQQGEAERILDVVKGLRAWSCSSWRSCWRRIPMASCWRPRSFWCGTVRIGSGCDCGRPLWRSGKKGACGSRAICSECHESAKFVEYRDRDVRTLLESGRHDRAYYHSGHCGHGCSGPTSLKVFTALRRCLASVFGAFNNPATHPSNQRSGNELRNVVRAVAVLVAVVHRKMDTAKRSESRCRASPIRSRRRWR